jgi:hypothetical protein
MPRPDVRAIRARADAATKGEWLSRRHGRTFSITAGMPGRDLVVVADVYDDPPELGGSPGEPDAVFIASARADVPALCDRVEELEAALLLATTPVPTLAAAGAAIRKCRAVLEGRDGE